MKLFYSGLILLLTLSCATSHKKVANNDPAHIEKPYILLVSIDGYRHDYTDHYKPEFLTQFRNKAASLKSLRPSFPTKTFPNHLSIVTGTLPAKHGIVANSFFAPDLNDKYALRKKKAVVDGRYYKSMPFWSLAESHNMRTATYFWPGSEAEISGYRPSYYLPYNHGTPHEDRINQVVNWFKLPKEKRPHFVTLYFHDVDSAGHRHGPISKETGEAITKVDKSLKELDKRLKELNLPINMIIVSDHGMMDLSEQKFEHIIKDELDQKHLSKFISIGHGPLVHLYKWEETNVDAALKSFNKGAKNYKCYTNKNTPKKLKFRNNQRIGDIVCIANYKWSIGTSERIIPNGNHGWSQYKTNDMHAIFYASGPNFKKSFVHKTQDNINIFPLMSKILDLKYTHQIDGKLWKMKPLLK